VRQRGPRSERTVGTDGEGPERVIIRRIGGGADLRCSWLFASTRCVDSFPFESTCKQFVRELCVPGGAATRFGSPSAPSCAVSLADRLTATHGRPITSPMGENLEHRLFCFSRKSGSHRHTKRESVRCTRTYLWRVNVWLSGPDFSLRCPVSLFVTPSN
jgi:hypothetical protein